MVELFAVNWGGIGWGALIGGSLAGFITGILGAYAASRQGRIETYRRWQTDLASDFLVRIGQLRRVLGGAAPANTPSAEELVGDLAVLSERMTLVFRRREGKGVPAAADAVVNAAREAVEVNDTGRLRNPCQQFVARASNDIRGRRW
jgi:hypothetical protein